MLPFLISIIVIASYGCWNFTRHVTSKKMQIGFIMCAIFAHAATSLSYWERLYFSPSTFWTNPLPYGTFQESLANPFVLVANAIFVAFFAYIITIWLKNKRRMIA
jgi:hypothetical protein